MTCPLRALFLAPFPKFSGALNFMMSAYSRALQIRHFSTNDSSGKEPLQRQPKSFPFAIEKEGTLVFLQIES